jgi:integrase
LRCTGGCTTYGIGRREAIGRGHDIRTVAGRLGHANPAMTLRTYAHAIDGADAGVAATLAESLDGET